MRRIKLKRSKRLAVLLLTACTVASSLTTFAAEEPVSDNTTNRFEHNIYVTDPQTSIQNAQAAADRVAYNNLPTLGDTILELANSAIGVPYRRGGTTTNGFDCSGLVQWVYEQVGVELPHNSSAIKSLGTKVDDPQPGDIVWSPGHVAIYVGDGEMIEAPKPGLKVRQVPVRSAKYYRIADVTAKYTELVDAVE